MYPDWQRPGVVFATGCSRWASAARSQARTKGGSAPCPLHAYYDLLLGEEPGHYCRWTKRQTQQHRAEWLVAPQTRRPRMVLRRYQKWCSHGTSIQSYCSVVRLKTMHLWRHEQEYDLGDECIGVWAKRKCCGCKNKTWGGWKREVACRWRACT